MLALSQSLECQIVRLAADRGIVAVPAAVAPSTFEALQTAVQPGRFGAITVPVWNGASTDTIWSGPKVNYLFRALHDVHHVELGAGFDAAGEREASRYLWSMIRGRLERRTVWAETFGQVRHFLNSGQFPIQQRSFVEATR